MILQYSFKKSFLISHPPLKPDQQPIQQLLPPQIPPSSLVRTYSFSQLKHNESFKEQFNDSSIELPKNPKLIDQMEHKIQELKNQLKKQKQKRINFTEENKQLDEKYQNLLKTRKEKDKDDVIKQQKRQLMKKITILQQQVSVLKGEIQQKAQQLITYESRSEQSRRLLQKLNQNINKKQSKLLKDKEVIIKELEDTKRLLEESKLKELQTSIELKQSQQKIQQIIQERQKELKLGLETKFNQFIKQNENKLQQKDKQIEILNAKLSQTQIHYDKKLSQIKNQINQEESAKFTNESLIEQLRQQITTKDQSIQKLILKHKELSSMIQNLQSRLQQTQTETCNIRQSQSLRISKLQIKIANYQYEAKQNQQKLSYLQEENQRMNVLVNQLKQDKKILNKQKEQLRTQLNQNTQQTQNLRNKLQLIKENDIKHSSIIENYQKEEQRFYDQQARLTSTLATLQIKLKSNAIESQKLNLKLSEKQQELNKTHKQLEKYKKMYKTQHQTLEMYKQQTHSMKQKTQQKWNQLKAYYENQIDLLQERISQNQSINANDSRIKIRNLMTNEKAKINSSRLSINRGTPKSIEKEDPTHLTLKRKILYRTNDPDEELKQNYWHGLNNDSLDHSDQQVSKN